VNKGLALNSVSDKNNGCNSGAIRSEKAGEFFPRLFCFKSCKREVKMKTTQVGSFTANARLISLSTSEFLKRFRHEFLLLGVENRKDLVPEIVLELMRLSDSHTGLFEKLDDARVQKTRNGSLDEPSKSTKYNKGHNTLDNPAHEALAHFLITPRTEREFKSLTALAEHFKISRMSVHRWKKNGDVLRRAEWLSRENKLVGDFIARREWQRIVAVQVNLAKRGNTAAARFCKRRAWPDDRQSDAGLSTIDLYDAVRATENTEITPSWMEKDFLKDEMKPNAASGDGHGGSESDWEVV
jgi:hypothetical protein